MASLERRAKGPAQQENFRSLTKFMTWHLTPLERLVISAINASFDYSLDE
jgi:hypothetical protein